MKVVLYVFLAVGLGCVPAGYVVGLCYLARWLTARGR